MLDKRKHRLHLIRILNYIYKNTKLGSTLGFKGGTAGYLFYGLPRFSTDLDFDIINGSANIQKIIDTLKIYVSKEYKILDQYDKRFTILWELSYEKYANNIKIEISKRNSEFYKYRNENLYGNNVKVVKVGHLIVQKMIALRNRSTLANRDIYDVNYFLKSKFVTDIDYDVLEKFTGKDKIDFLNELKEYLIGNKPKNILDGLGEVVDSKEKDWIRSSLFDETLELLQMLVDT